MTKKHFEALANALASARPNTDAPDRPTWDTLLDRIAHVCATTNPRFDRGRFMRAAKER